MKIHYTDSLTRTLDVLYQLARENCLSLRKIHVIREVTACCNGTACGFICIVPRAKHQPRCGNDLALAALSRCVSPFLPLLPSRSSPVLRRTPRRVAAAGIIGFSRIRICGSWMQEAGGDGISNAVNGRERRGSTSKKECAPFEETAEQRNLNVRGKQDDNAILIIASS